ncbi:MAG: DUF58 domain-containing protein [Anaerolineae bacterium]|nr:DUF58 domain-containing protein [Anaerolineae bacterium]
MIDINASQRHLNNLPRAERGTDLGHPGVPAATGGENWHNGRVYLRLRSPLVPFLLAVVAFLQFTNPSRAWSLLFWGLGLVLLVAYYWARQMRDGVTATRRLRRTWVVVGDPLEEAFVLVNSSSLPVLWAEAVDGSNVPGYQASRVEAVGGNSEKEWTTSVVCRQRGLFTLGPWELRMGDPFGLFTVTHVYPETRSILVYPRVVHLPPLQLPLGAAAGIARSTRRTSDPTLLTASVRDYAPGDPLKRVHWPSTARRRMLMVKEYDKEPSGDLWICLDMDTAVQVGAGEESTEEYGVILAASSAAEWLRASRAVGLVAFGVQAGLLPPRRGQTQLWRILHELAAAKTSPDWPLPRVLREVAPSLGWGQTVAVFTPRLDADWIGPLLDLRARGLSLVTVLIDANSFSRSNRSGEEAGSGRERLSKVRNLLAEQGIVTYVIAKGYPFRALIKYKRRRTEFKVLGTGRVVPYEVEEEVG